MDFYVFDLDFNFCGILDDYVSIPLTRSYEKKTSFTIEVSPTDKNIQLLKKDRLIAKETDLEHAFIIKTIEYKDGKDSSLSATVFSLHDLLSKRVIVNQHTFYGSVGFVLSKFVDVNAVNPTNKNRIIPNLTIDSSNDSIGESISESRTTGQLDDVLFDIAKKYEISWDILFDYENNQYIFKVWKGTDRSEQQDENDHVVFAKEFDNVITQDYVDSDSDYKSTAIVAGEGEGDERKRVIVNDGLSGWERNELFVDARDLQSTYTDDDGEEQTISNEEYDKVLIERGKSKLAEHQKIQTLESELDFDSSLKYGKDYFLGDIISVKNTKLDLILNTRITQVIEKYTKEGMTIQAEFGSNIPNFLDKLKKAVKN